MAKKFEHLRKKAIELREQGYALNDIHMFLSMKKTTVYYWIKDIPLDSRTTKQSLAQKKGTKAAVDKWAAIRDTAYRLGTSEFDGNDKRIRDFTLIYLTEGYRRTRNVVQVTNSNPVILKLAADVIREYSDKPLNVQVQYYEDHKCRDLKAYWGDQLRINPNCIKLFPKSNSGRLSGRNWRSENGVAQVSVGDTKFRSRIQGWMDNLQKEWKLGYTKCI